MTFSEVKKLFNYERLHYQQSFTIFLLYIPIGLILVLCRLLVLLFIYPIFCFLPRSKYRSYVLKVICFLFGAVIKADTSLRDKRVKLMVCNHISIFDHLVLDSALDCRKINNSSHFHEASIDFSNFPTAYVETSVERICEDINASNTAVLVFPEILPTNGKFGLLKFALWPFTLNLDIQPVILRYSAKLIAINPVVVGSSLWKNVFWCFFTPYAVFEIKVLPVMAYGTSLDFSEEVQKYMASALNITATNCTLRDVLNYASQVAALISSNQLLHSSDALSENISKQYSEETNKMAAQVKEILQNVPLFIILEDIEKTKSVEKTIIRLSRKKNESEETSEPGENEDVTSLNTGASTFGKTPEQRMFSYKERKEALLLAARLRYWRKHHKPDNCCDKEQ